MEKSKKKKHKGLSDSELVRKYESGKFNLKEAIRPMLKGASKDPKTKNRK